MIRLKPLNRSITILNTKSLFQSNHLENPCFTSKRTFSSESLTQTHIGLFKTLSDSTPVEYIQKFLITVHDTTGLPWWASIICSTFFLRSAITFPLAVHQQHVLARLENVKKELPAIADELRRETSIAVKMYNWDEKTAKAAFKRSMKKQWDNLIVKNNCHPFKATLLLWFQIPMWISLSIGLRNLVYMLPNRDMAAQFVYTQLSIGGFGFIPNLTQADASFIFPVALGLLNLAIVELQVLSKSHEPSKVQKIITYLFRGFSVLLIPISASVPSCLVLYWTTSSAVGLAQNLILLSPKVKRFFRIPKTDSELENPYSHIITRLKKTPFNK